MRRPGETGSCLRQSSQASRGGTSKPMQSRGSGKAPYPIGARVKQEMSPAAGALLPPSFLSLLFRPLSSCHLSSVCLYLSPTIFFFPPPQWVFYFTPLFLPPPPPYSSSFSFPAWNPELLICCPPKNLPVTLGTFWPLTGELADGGGQVAGGGAGSRPRSPAGMDAA